MRRALPPLLAVPLMGALTACPAKTELAEDAGVSDGGTSDGGFDAGGLTACRRNTPQSCPVGQSCMLAQNPSGSSFCFPGECDLFLQNCDGGLTCGYDATGKRACLTPGPQAEGTQCVGGACQADLLCVADATGQNAVCRKLCSQSTDCTSPKVCLGTAGLPGNNEAFTFCIPPPAACDLLGQDCADAGESCYLTSSGTACFVTGSVPLGQDCSTGLCGRGATCANVDGSPKCVKLCQFPSGPPRCDAGSCQQLSTNGTPVLDGGVGGCF